MSGLASVSGSLSVGASPNAAPLTKKQEATKAIVARILATTNADAFINDSSQQAAVQSARQRILKGKDLEKIVAGYLNAHPPTRWGESTTCAALVVEREKLLQRIDSAIGAKHEYYNKTLIGKICRQLPGNDTIARVQKLRAEVAAVFNHKIVARDAFEKAEAQKAKAAKEAAPRANAATGRFSCAKFTAGLTGIFTSCAAQLKHKFNNLTK